MVGGIGSRSTREDASHLMNQLAALIRAEPYLLSVPGIVGSASSVQILENDPYVSETMRLFDQIGLAFLKSDRQNYLTRVLAIANRPNWPRFGIKEQLAPSVFEIITPTGLKFANLTETVSLEWL
jgi:hypothetical protein